MVDIESLSHGDLVRIIDADMPPGEHYTWDSLGIMKKFVGHVMTVEHIEYLSGDCTWYATLREDETDLTSYRATYAYDNSSRYHHWKWFGWMLDYAEDDDSLEMVQDEDIATLLS